VSRGGAIRTCRPGGARSLWTRTDAEQVERRLAELVAWGHSVEEAVRAVHRDDGLGALLICPAVEAVAGLPPQEVNRLVVRALSPLWDEPEEVHGDR
jgi:hypothetical protein